MALTTTTQLYSDDILLWEGDSITIAFAASQQHKHDKRSLQAFAAQCSLAAPHRCKGLLAAINAVADDADLSLVTNL